MPMGDKIIFFDQTEEADLVPTPHDEGGFLDAAASALHELTLLDIPG